MNKIFWNDEEEFALARAFVMLRTSDPFSSDTQLFIKGMRNTIPQNRWRTVNSVAQLKALKTRIAKLWEETVSKADDSIASAPEPDVITLEVEKPIDFRELADRLDGPTLAALAFHKMEKVMAALSVARVEIPKPPGPVKPSFSIIDSASPKARKTRVVVLAMAKEFHHIKADTSGLEDRLDVTYVDNDQAVGRTFTADYAVLHLGSSSHKNYDGLRATMDRNRLFYVNGSKAIVQKLYDIASLKK